MLLAEDLLLLVTDDASGRLSRTAILIAAAAPPADIPAMNTRRRSTAYSAMIFRVLCCVPATGSGIDAGMSPHTSPALTAKFARAHCRTGSSRPGSFSQRSLSLPPLALTSLRPCSSTHERRTL